MKIVECYHIRIRDGNDYRMNVERMIKHLEDLYKIDFRTLPRWEELAQRMHLAITDCRRKIQDANRRKATIIDKLCIEFCRPSPFDLTNNLVRTATKWQKNEAKMKVKKKSSISLTESLQISSREQIVFDEVPGEVSPGHPNTEVIASMEPGGRERGKEEPVVVAETVMSTNLPAYVRSNQHKHVASLRSLDSFLTLADSGPAAINLPHKSEKKPDEWLVLPQSKNIICIPNMIAIEDKSLEEQTISFSLVNCSSEYPYLNLRYKGVTDNVSFKRSKIFPATPVKLFPGLAVNFKFFLKLKQNEENFETNLFFRVGQKVLAEAPLEGFSIPVVATFVKKPACVYISEIINIPPVYFWHFNAKSAFPSGKLIVNIPDDQCYDLRITKQPMNLTDDLENDVCSIEPISLSSETMDQREIDEEMTAQSKPFISNESLEDTESFLLANSLGLILHDVIEQVLDIFVFDKTFLRLEPFSKNSIKVFQTKAKHIGFHHDIYELEFTNPVTGEIVWRKRIKVFGNVLPNPIEISPRLLDMTESPVVQGRCEDRFTIMNNHKTSVTVKIKLAAKMKKLIRIVPKETLIPARSSVDFLVGFCSKDLNQPFKEDFVHLTLQIIVIGDKLVFHDLPGLYYEILAPFSAEFMKLDRALSF